MRSHSGHLADAPEVPEVATGNAELPRDPLGGHRIGDGVTRGLLVDLHVQAAIDHVIGMNACAPMANASSVPLSDTDRQMFELLIASWLEGRSGEVRRQKRRLAASVALDAAEMLVHGVALRAPKVLASEAFATEVTDLIVRYLAK
jgi:Tetracyclin repressor-like, C-terminal domain